MYNLSPIFSFLPTQLVKADHLEKGDIALIHSRWEVVLASQLEDKDYNHGYNLLITKFDESGAYLKPAEEIRVIRRDLVDIQKMLKFIDDELTARAEQRKFDEAEEKERAEEERAYLQARLRELED